MELVQQLEKNGWLKTLEIKEAFKKIKRKDFLTEDTKDLADFNQALSIGFNQTISQPLVVAFMMELLEPKKGEKILDIGSGSGWTSALLAYLVGKKGKVISLEIIPQLEEFAKKNIAKYNFIEKKIVETFCRDGSKGYAKQAPFDKILVSAAAQRIPSEWKEQVKEKGRIVFPMNNSIWLYIKKNNQEFTEIEYPGFIFVPLVEKNN